MGGLDLTHSEDEAAVLCIGRRFVNQGVRSVTRNPFSFSNGLGMVGSPFTDQVAQTHLAI
jgi:hypothetical protein